VIDKRIVPFLFTFGNLIAGVIALMLTMQSAYQLAAIAIIIAGLLDWFDGRIARYLNVSSSMGKEMDSLADLVSFGVAPAILIWETSLSTLGLLGMVITIFFPVCGAYRLARYNVKSFSGVFEGVPITAAGGFVALVTLIMNTKLTEWFYAALLLLFGWLMVSHIRVPKF